VAWSELGKLDSWVRDCYMNIRHPYHVHMVYSYVSWVERYQGTVPPAVLQMVEAVKQGQHLGVDLRQSDDLDQLLRSPSYVLGRGLLKACLPLYCAYRMSA